MSLLDPLIPQRTQRLLRAVVLNAGCSFSVNDLVRASGGSKAAAVHIIARFIKSGLVTEQRIGNQRRIKFNGEWPLAQELRQLLVKSIEVSEPSKEALPRPLVLAEQ